MIGGDDPGLTRGGLEASLGFHLRRQEMPRRVRSRRRIRVVLGKTVDVHLRRHALGRGLANGGPGDDARNLGGMFGDASCFLVDHPPAELLVGNTNRPIIPHTAGGHRGRLLHRLPHSNSVALTIESQRRRLHRQINRAHGTRPGDVLRVRGVGRIDTHGRMVRRSHFALRKPRVRYCRQQLPGLEQFHTQHPPAHGRLIITTK